MGISLSKALRAASYITRLTPQSIVAGYLVNKLAGVVIDGAVYDLTKFLATEAVDLGSNFLNNLTNSYLPHTSSPDPDQNNPLSIPLSTQIPLPPPELPKFPPLPPPELPKVPLPPPDPLRPDIPRAGLSPIVLDLNGNDTIDYLNLNQSPAYFDLTASGFAIHTSWITGGDGFLVYDRNNDGIINNINELFGADAGSGAYEKLAALNSNADAVIDASDPQFEQLQVWVDINLDGYSHPWELFSLEEAGIATIGLDVTLIPEGSQAIGDGFIPEASYFIFEDGTVKQTADVFFNNDPVNSLYVGDFEFNEAVFDLPFVRGYGLLPDLAIAASQNAALLQTVQGLTALDPTNIFGINLQLDVLLYQWAGSLGNNPRNTRLNFDERKLGVLEAIAVQEANFEEDVFPLGGFSDVGASYDAAKSELAKGLLINGTFSNQFAGFDFNPFSGEVFANAPQLADAITALEAVEPSTASEQALFWQLLYPTLEAAQESATLADFDARISNAIAGSGLVLDDLKTDRFGTLFDESVLPSLNGNKGDDLIIATDGDKIISPNDGNDLIYWGNGDGNDTLAEFGQVEDVDTIVIEFSTTQAELTASGQDLDITNTVTGETLTVFDFYEVADGGNKNSVERITFSDISYTNGELFSALNTTGSGNDTLTGSNGDDRFTLSEGDDLARGFLGNDRYDVYADGDHAINDFSGNDTAFTDAAYIYGITPEQTALSQDGNDIVLSFGSAGSLTFENQLLSGIGRIEEVHFIDDPSTVWTAADLEDVL